MIAHLVLLEPHAELPREDREALQAALEVVRREVPVIREARVGRAIRTGAAYEARLGEAPYKYAAMLVFDNRHDLSIYLNHPAHEPLAALLWKVARNTMVIDLELAEVAHPDLKRLLGD